MLQDAGLHIFQFSSELCARESVRFCGVRQDKKQEIIERFLPQQTAFSYDVF